MLKRSFMILSVVGLLYGCDSEKKEAASLRTTVDSLRLQLAEHYKTVATIQEIGALIDSIDANRKVLRVRMGDGTSMDDYRGRMREINQYVKETQNRITLLERKITSSNNSSSGYGSTIKKLRQELETRNEELAALQEQVNLYHNEKENLVQTVSLQKAELTDKLAQIEVKQQEVIKLEARVSDLLSQAKLDEAESYFLRAQALEEAANRTKFAPRKKKNTRIQALELYKLAVASGKEEAQVKVAELEKKI